MFCPKCGSTQDDALRFCKLCGANLYAVRQVVDTRETEDKVDWSKTWVAEMFRSSEETKRRKLEMERRVGITPEMKRITEIKAGVITGSLGIGIAVLLYVLMEGIILGGNVSSSAIEILSRLWIVGIIPLLVGIALIINGMFVSKKLVELAKRTALTDSNAQEEETEPHALRSGDTTQFIPSSLSVTEGTTKHLRSSGQK
ncbi:MAG: hypothetical protein ACRD8U_09725 [Pyrinomonadaceae bacterium]